jgi:hypothetical protein
MLPNEQALADVVHARGLVSLASAASVPIAGGAGQKKKQRRQKVQFAKSAANLLSVAMAVAMAENTCSGAADVATVWGAVSEWAVRKKE